METERDGEVLELFMGEGDERRRRRRKDAEQKAAWEDRERGSDGETACP